MFDTINSAVVTAIDSVSSQAPGVNKWWEDLVLPAEAIRQSYINCVSYPHGQETVRPFAYLPFFAPRYLPRFRHALRAAGLDLCSLLRLTSGGIRVLDLGAGTGILTVACLLELNRSCRTIQTRARVEVTLRDRDRESSDVARLLLELLQQDGAWPHLDVTWKFEQQSILSEPDNATFDLVLLGHVICEFYQCQSGEITHVENILGPLLEVLERQLSKLGVAVIIEPLNQKYPSVPLLIRDYIRKTGELNLLAPCLGRGRVCPEHRNPYHGPPACSGSTYSISWDRNSKAGQRLWRFSEAAKLIKWGSLTLSPSCFFPLVLSAGEREDVPAEVGMAVRRLGPPAKTQSIQPVCLVGTDGLERIIAISEPGARAHRSVLRPVTVQNDRLLSDYESLSALYPSGWPVGK